MAVAVEHGAAIWRQATERARSALSLPIHNNSREPYVRDNAQVPLFLPIPACLETLE